MEDKATVGLEEGVNGVPRLTHQEHSPPTKPPPKPLFMPTLPTECPPLPPKTSPPPLTKQEHQARRRSSKRRSVVQVLKPSKPNSAVRRRSSISSTSSRSFSKESIEEHKDFLNNWKTVQMLERYVPDIVMEHVIEATHSYNAKRFGKTNSANVAAVDSQSSRQTHPNSEEDDDETVQRLYEHDAVVVLADISGFTKLAERLARDNTGGEGHGTETLSRKLNSYFGRMIDMIYMGGGDVVKFAGDALLVVWRKKDDDNISSVASSVVRKESPESSGTSFNSDELPLPKISKKRRSSTLRRPSVQLPANKSGIVDVTTGRNRRTSMVSNASNDGDIRRSSLTSTSSDLMSQSMVGARRRVSISHPLVCSTLRRESKVFIPEVSDNNINNGNKDDADGKNNLPSDYNKKTSSKRMPPIRTTVGIGRNFTRSRRKSSVLLASEALFLNQNVESSSSSSDYDKSDDGNESDDGIIRMTSNDDRGTRIMKIKSKDAKSTTATNNKGRRTSIRKQNNNSSSVGARTMKRRDSWRTTMTNWRKQKGRTRGSVHGQLEARRRSIVGMQSNSSLGSPLSDGSIRTSDLDDSSLYDSYRASGSGSGFGSGSSNMGTPSPRGSGSGHFRVDSESSNDETDDDDDGDFLLYKELYKTESDSGGSGNEFDPIQINLTTIENITSRRGTSKMLKPIRDDDDGDENNTSQLPPPPPSTLPSFITPPINKFVEALRSKLNEGNISGNEYVQMVAKQLEMHALGLVNEVNFPISRKDRGETEANSSVTSSMPGDLIDTSQINKWTSPSDSRLRNLCRKMSFNIIVKDRRKLLRTHKKCFIGHEAVLFLKECEDIDTVTAVRLGNKLCAIGLIEKITSKKDEKNIFRDDGSFYRFMMTSQRSHGSGSGSNSSNADLNGDQKTEKNNVYNPLDEIVEKPSILQSYNQQLAILQEIISKNKEENKTTNLPAFKLSHLTDVVHRCVHTCLEMVNKLDNFEGLRLHVGIGCGNVLFMHVGGVCERLEFIVAGEALVHMSHAEAQSKAGDVCVSANVWSMIEGISCGHPTLDSFEAMSDTSIEHDYAYLVVSMNQEPASNPSERRWVQWNQARHLDVFPNPCKENGGRPVLPSQIGSQVMLYVPGAVRNKLAHLHAGSQFKRGQISASDVLANQLQSDEKNFNGDNGDISELGVDQQKLFEFRRASILFVNLPGIDYSADAETVLCTLQHALVSMQEILVDLEGSLRQFIMDDKGTTLIGVFGLYPAHENDPHLATQCAMEMVKRLKRLGMVLQIGVTTGNVFAAEVGNERRCEFAVIGDVVNLSARLMVAAGKLSKSTKSEVNILCDHDTWKVARTHIRFREMTPIRVKGKSNKILIYQPLEIGASDEDDTDQISFVGNIASRKKCLKMFERLFVSGNGGVVLIEGDVGSGKTRFIRETLKEARETSFDKRNKRNQRSHRGSRYGSANSAASSQSRRRDFMRHGRYNGPTKEKNKIYSMMSAADPISQFVPFNSVFELTLHILKRLRCVEEYIDTLTGDRTLRLNTKRTKIGRRKHTENRKSTSSDNSMNNVNDEENNDDGNEKNLASRLYLLNRVFPELALEVAENPNLFREENEKASDKESFDTEERGSSKTVSSKSFSGRNSFSGSGVFDDLMNIEEANELHESVRDVILLLIEEYIKYRDQRPLVFSFDDGQWMDAWSWSLIVQLKSKIVEKGWPLLILAATRTTASVDGNSNLEETKSTRKSKSRESEDCSYVHLDNSGVESLSPLRTGSSTIKKRLSFSSRIHSLKKLHSRSVASSSSVVSSGSDKHEQNDDEFYHAISADNGNIHGNRRRSFSNQSDQSDLSSVEPPSSNSRFSSNYMKHLMSGDKSSAIQVTMSPLSRQETGILMAGVIGAEPPTRIVQHVLNRTKGNPLYTIETTQGLLASKVLVVVLGECQITSTLDANNLHLSVPLPDSLQGILRSNIDRLPSATQEILQIASIAASSASPITVDLLCYMFVGEQLWNQSADGGSESGVDHEKAYAHVKKEIQTLIKSRRLIVTRSTNGMVTSKSTNNLNSMNSMNNGGSSDKHSHSGHNLDQDSIGSVASVHVINHASSISFADKSNLSSNFSWSNRIIRFARNELQEIAYKISPFSVRQRLHHRAAIFYERILQEKYPPNSLSALKGSNAIFNTLIETVALHFELAGKFMVSAKYVVRAIFIYARNYEYTKEVQLVRQMIRLVENDSNCGTYVDKLVEDGRSNHTSSHIGSSISSNRGITISSGGGKSNSSGTKQNPTFPPPLAVLYGKLGCGLLHLGILTEAEKYLCLCLDKLNEYPNYTNTWINAPEGGRIKKRTSRLSVFSRTTLPSSSPKNHRKEQKARVSNHTSNYQTLLNKISKSIVSWSTMVSNMATHHKHSDYYTIFTSCRVRIALAQVQHELNHPFRGLVLLHGAIEMALSTNGPSPLLAHGLACIGELSRSVLENDKLSSIAVSHAKSISDYIYSPPTTAFILRHEAQLLLIKGDLNGAIQICCNANSILGALKDVRAMEYTSLLMGDCYVLQGKVWLSLTEYNRIINSAHLRSDWRMQLPAFFGQAYVHFIGRDWKQASETVRLCESLVTDIVAALDSATVITVRSFILLAEISQYKVDMNVLHSTIDMILGIPSENNASDNISTKNATGSNSDWSVEGIFVDAGRAFQYHHRALFVYYAIIMSSLTILESCKFDERREKEIKKTEEAKSLDHKSSMSMMISKKMRKMSSFLGRSHSSSNSSSASNSASSSLGNSPANKVTPPTNIAANRYDTELQQKQNIRSSDSSAYSSTGFDTVDHSVGFNTRGQGFGMTSSTTYGEVKILPTNTNQSPLEHAQRHLSYGLGTGIPNHGQSLLRPLYDTVSKASHEVKRLHDRTHMMLKSMKHFVHSSYPVGIGMYKYLSGYHHWVRGNEGQARAKWKFGVSHGDKHGMELWSNLCQQQLLRTDSHLQMNIDEYKLVANRFETLGFPHLQQAVNDEIASFNTAGKEWRMLKQEVEDIHHQRIKSRLNQSFDNYNHDAKRKSRHDTDHNRMLSSGRYGHTPEGRRGSVLRDADFSERRRGSVLRGADFSKIPIVASRKSVTGS